MKTDPLLDAIFQPGEDSLNVALAAARRRRVRRALAPVAMAGSTLAVALFLLARTHEAPLPQVAALPLKPVIEAIPTRPFAPKELVRTRKDSITIVTTAAAKATPAPIAESELLSLLGPDRMALVGSGAERRLIEF